MEENCNMVYSIKYQMKTKIILLQPKYPSVYESGMYQNQIYIS